MATAAYRADASKDVVGSDGPFWLDVLAMMVVPCLPLGRAASMAGCPFLIVFLLAGGLYVSGLWIFTDFYSQDGYTMLQFLSGWTVIFVGWFLYAFGPVIAIAILASWYVKAFGCSLNDTGEPPCNDASEEPDHAAAAVGCFLLLFLVTYVTTHVLLRRYTTKDQRDCGNHCLSCCLPCCAVARALHIAREARAHENDQDSELPAYSA